MQPSSKRLVTEERAWLTPITSDTNPPAGVSVGQLAGFVNVGTDLVTVGEAPLDPQQIVVLWWDGSKWQVASAGGAAATEPPLWAAGTTATTGDPTHEGVLVVFSQPIPSGQLQVRYGSTDTWRNASKVSATEVQLSGLSPLTAYAAPQFQVVNSAGSSSVVTAQAFTTDPKPKEWTQKHLATFTAPDGTLIENYVPEKGAPLAITGATAAKIDIADGKTRCSWTGTNYPSLRATWNTTNADLNVRASITADFPAWITMHRDETVIVEVRMGGQMHNPASTLTEVYNSGMSPTSGTMTLAASGTPDAFTVEMEVDGILHRRWTGTTNSGYGKAQQINRVAFMIGGGDLHSGNPVSKHHVDKIDVHYWA